MQATGGVNPESDTNRDVKVILVEDSVKEDSGIGSTSGVSANSSLNDEAGTSPRVCRITKNIIIEFQALNCKANGNRESTFVISDELQLMNFRIEMACLVPGALEKDVIGTKAVKGLYEASDAGKLTIKPFLQRKITGSSESCTYSFDLSLEFEINF